MQPKDLLHFDPISCFQGPTLPIGAAKCRAGAHTLISGHICMASAADTRSDMTAMLAESVSVYTPSSSWNFSVWSSMCVALCRFRRKSPCRTLRRSATAFAAALSDVNVPMYSPARACLSPLISSISRYSCKSATSPYDVFA